MSGITSNGAARIYTSTDATNLTVRTNDTIAWPHARAFFAFLPRGTHDGDACNVDAKTIRIAYFALSADEFATIAFRNARSLIANLACFAKVAFVCRTITIVIESVAFFSRGLIRLHARQRSALTLHRSIGANAGLARIARSSAARTSDSRDERRQVVEIIVSAGQQVFPAEVKRILRRRAVVNQQMDEWIGLVAICVVLLLTVKDIHVVSRRRTIGYTFVERDFTTRVTRVIFDVERLRRPDAIGARQEFVQISRSRFLSRNIVPAERVLITRVALEHGKRQTARRNECFGGCRCLRKRVDIFAATRKHVLQAITYGNRRSVGLRERQCLARDDCGDGEKQREGSFAHPLMLERRTKHHKRSFR